MILNLPTSEPPINVDGSVLSDQKALPAGFINSTERWYGTPYLANGISVEQLKSLDNAAVDMDGIWKLPGSNRFIPDDIALVSGNTNLKPSLVHSAETSGANPSRSQVWHALDNSFDSPKQVYFLKFCYPTAHLWLLLVFSITIHSVISSQYTHLETFCPSPPAASALAQVTAAVLSKLITNNLLPQVL